MTLSEIEAELYRRTGYKASPAAEIITRFRSYINISHRQLLTTPGLGSLRDDTITFDSIATYAVYGLPIAKVAHFQDRTNQRALRERSLTWLRQTDPGLQQTGTPSVYVPRGYQAIAFQPAAACTIYVTSTSASDVGLAYLEGVRSSGAAFTTSVTMTGTTPVAFSAFTDVIAVSKFYLAVTAVGLVTITEGAP